MTQRTFFTRESVLDTAFALTRETGWGGVSARSIAKRLGSSTMPIYSSLKSMEEIEQETRVRAESLLQDFQGRRYTGNAALDMAVGYVGFARQEPHLFRFLYVDRPRHVAAPELESQSEELRKRSLGSAGLREMLDSIPELATNPLVLKTWIFVHGLASLVSSGALELPEQRVRDLLQEAGEAFVAQEGLKREARNG